MGDDFLIAVSSEHKVDVFRRGSGDKMGTLEIDYMRCSLVHENYVFIGTEEKMLFLVDATSFEIVDKMMT